MPESRGAKLLNRVLPARPRERELDAELAAVETVLSRLDGDHENLTEKLQSIEMMIDAQGWTSIFDLDDHSGVSLQQIKAASKQLRELVAGNPFLKRGSQLRNTYVWGGGLEFSGQNRTNGKNVKIPANVQELMEAPKNQRYIFGNDAHEEFERAAFTDGNVFLLGKDSTRQLQRVPIDEITGDLRNPDNHEEIIAYRREWQRNPTADEEKDRQTIVRWYYTDIFDGARRKTIQYGGKREQIEPGYTMLDKTFNRQVGWAYGVPDGLAVLAWVKLYREFLVNGYIMSRALARFAYKVTTSSAKGGNNASTEISRPGEAGSTYVEGSGQNLSPLTTAGKGYDFDAGRPLAGGIASGLEVSLTALLADSGKAGGGGAERTLDPPARATAQMRRLSWNDYWLRIFRWLGLEKKLVVTWKDLPEDTLQRILQAWTLTLNTELFKPEIIQHGIAEAMKISDPGDIPAGWKMPSERGGTTGPNNAGNAGATAGSGQGQGSPAGQSPDDHDDDDPDARTD